MKKQIKIKQFPANKDINTEILSFDQIKLRENAEVNKSLISQKCKQCGKTLPLEEFYVMNKLTGRRHVTCRDCKAQRRGKIHIGVRRHLKILYSKGFNRCYLCKKIKPLTDFYEDERRISGHSSSCKKCADSLDKERYYKNLKKTREKNRIKAKQRRERNPQWFKAYRESHRESLRLACKKYYDKCHKK